MKKNKDAPSGQNPPTKKPKFDDNFDRSRFDNPDQIDHIIAKPSMYLETYGERGPVTIKVVDEETKTFSDHSVRYNHGLKKIIDEAIDNACDVAQCSVGMTYLKIEFKGKDTFVITNDGEGIPVIKNDKGVYIPEMVFGTLLAGSNFKKRADLTLNGTNGIGVKLLVICSKKFTLETVDSARGLKYKQSWSDHMRTKTEPKITDSTKGFTKITCKLDLAMFNLWHEDKEVRLESLEDNDTMSVIRSRIYGVAACNPGIKVFLDGRRILVPKFQTYMKMFTSADSPRPSYYSCDRWEVGFYFQINAGFQQSFVNSVSTLDGGTHVDYISSQIFSAVSSSSKLVVTKATIMRHLCLFVNCRIVNPDFQSQTKVCLITHRKKFGSECSVPPAEIVSAFKKSKISEYLIKRQDDKQDRDDHKKDGKKTRTITGVPNLVDADEAGGANSQKCTFIACEGNSAFSVVFKGIKTLGQKRFGSMPFRGVGLNVSGKSFKRCMENPEFGFLVKIMGLEKGMVYTPDNISRLRYARFMCATDMDKDGAHITGLFMNIFATFWPSLLTVPKFFSSFNSMVEKVTRGKEVIRFYTSDAYQIWKEQVGADAAKWKSKHIKGLGTNTDDDISLCFSDLKNHRVYYHHSGDQCTAALDLVFNPKRADDRKVWIVSPLMQVDDPSKLSYCQFIHSRFKEFSKYDCQRSIPCVMDMKLSERKILFTCLEHESTNTEIKVAQLAGSVALRTAYEHGETSLGGTIVNLAQDYSGSNNINLLFPSGQMGSREFNGSDAADIRYIYTYVMRITCLIFKNCDSSTLDHNTVDGRKTEPKIYAPVIPTVLLNGASGIGTGFSSSVPAYNPVDIIRLVRMLLSGQNIDSEVISPWYRGCQPVVDGVMRGVMKLDPDGKTLTITDLPINISPFAYTKILETMQSKSQIVSFKKLMPQAEGVISQFVVTMADTSMATYKMFRLEYRIPVNMHLLDENGEVQDFKTPIKVIKTHFEFRMRHYVLRKKNIEEKLGRALLILKNKVNYVEAVLAQQFLPNQGDDEIAQFFHENSYLEVDGGYAYLLDISQAQLTKKAVSHLRDDLERKTRELDDVLRKDVIEMWAEDIALIEKELAVIYPL